MESAHRWTAERPTDRNCESSGISEGPRTAFRTSDDGLITHIQTSRISTTGASELGVHLQGGPPDKGLLSRRQTTLYGRGEHDRSSTRVSHCVRTIITPQIIYTTFLQCTKHLLLRYFLSNEEGLGGARLGCTLADPPLSSSSRFPFR